MAGFGGVSASNGQIKTWNRHARVPGRSAVALSVAWRAGMGKYFAAVTPRSQQNALPTPT